MANNFSWGAEEEGGKEKGRREKEEEKEKDESVEGKGTIYRITGTISREQGLIFKEAKIHATA